MKINDFPDLRRAEQERLDQLRQQRLEEQRQEQKAQQGKAAQENKDRLEKAKKQEQALDPPAQEHLRANEPKNKKTEGPDRAELDLKLPPDAKAGDVIRALGKKMAQLFEKLSDSFDQKERRHLAKTFCEMAVAALKKAGIKAELTKSVDKIKIIEDGQEKIYDLVRNANVPGAKSVCQFHECKPGQDTARDFGGPPGAPRVDEIFYDTCWANVNLLMTARFASSMNERLSAIAQLRSLIVAALVEAGHDAEEIGRVDKVEINGKKYDLFRASQSLGERVTPQLLEVGES